MFNYWFAFTNRFSFTNTSSEPYNVYNQVKRLYKRVISLKNTYYEAYSALVVVLAGRNPFSIDYSFNSNDGLRFHTDRWTDSKPIYSFYFVNGIFCNLLAYLPAAFNIHAELYKRLRLTDGENSSSDYNGYDDNAACFKCRMLAFQNEIHAKDGYAICKLILFILQH